MDEERKHKKKKKRIEKKRTHESDLKRSRMKQSFMQKKKIWQQQSFHSCDNFNSTYVPRTTMLFDDGFNKKHIILRERRCC